MNKNAPAAQDAMFALQSVADISNEAGQKCFTQEGTIFDDLSLIGARPDPRDAYRMRSPQIAGIDGRKKPPQR